jgi:oligoribonuclease
MQSPTHLIWLDLEMTGLDPERDRIIEVACIITDADLQIVAEGPNVPIHVPDALLDGMDEWCTKTHTSSGLVDRIRATDLTIAQADVQTRDFVAQHVPKGASPLCGNSIAHDRRFVRREMPLFHEWLHYRNVDVSTIKELVRRWYPQTVRAPVKKGAHLALDDIRESIAELAWYRRHVFVAPPGQ